MKKISIFLFIFILTMQSYTAQKFNLGDKINLKILNSTESEIKESFENVKNIDLESVKQDKNGVIVVFRAFELGNKTVKVGNKKIEFEVVTNLDENDKEIYMDLSDNSNKEMFKLTFPFISLLSLISFIVGLYFLIKSRKKNKILSPSEEFNLGMKSLDTNNWSYEISYFLRKYIDRVYTSNFISGNYEKIGVVENEDIYFLKTLDNYKFSNRNLENEDLEKENLIKKTYIIFERIEKSLKENEKNKKNSENNKKNNEFVEENEVKSNV
ncbi:MAG: hypothetical protein ACRCVS_04865 [Fusobacteriaceae bacterium]